MKAILRTGALGAALTLVPALAAAQTVNTTLAVANAYVWRGVTMADQTVLQGDLSVSLPAAGGTLTGGVWANHEIDPDRDRFILRVGGLHDN